MAGMVDEGQHVNFGTSDSPWKLCSPENVCMQIVFGTKAAAGFSFKASENGDDSFQVYLGNIVAGLTIVAILMGILLGVLWHSLNRNCKQHEKIIGAIPKLLTQLRADLREVEKKGKLVLPADRVRIIPERGYGEDSDDNDRNDDYDNKSNDNNDKDDENGGTREERVAVRDAESINDRGSVADSTSTSEVATPRSR